MPALTYWREAHEGSLDGWGARLRVGLFGHANPFAGEVAVRLAGARATLLALCDGDDVAALVRDALAAHAGPVLVVELPPYRGAAPAFAEILAREPRAIWLPRFRHFDSAALHLMEASARLISTHAGLVLAARALGLETAPPDVRVAAVGGDTVRSEPDGAADADGALCRACPAPLAVVYAPAPGAVSVPALTQERRTRRNAPPPRPARDAMRRARSIKGIRARVAAEIEHLGRGSHAAFRPAEATAAHDAAARPLFVIVHAFHLEVFADILSELRALDTAIDLTVTCTPDRVDEVRALHSAAGLGVAMRIVPAENHGRDVLPFLRALPVLELRDDDVVLKLHTKKSTHMEDGDAWRSVALGSLLHGGAASHARAAFAADARLGVLTPTWCKLPITSYLLPNEARIAALLSRLGMAPIDKARDVFAGGTMFYARYRTLRPALSLDLTREDFEAEAGQIDGTLAHALERLFSLSALRMGMRVREIWED